MRIEPIGHVESPYLTKFGIPRQPGLARGVTSRIVFDGGFGVNRDTRFSKGDWIVVIWSFSHNLVSRDSWSRTVRPPRLGGNTRVGVFATRSSFRPNNLAMSIVQVISDDGHDISFTGGDMVRGTPVYGVVPYEESRYAAPDANFGWPALHEWYGFDDVAFPADLRERVPSSLHDGIMQVLGQDPRPAYTRETQQGRVFWTAFDEYLILFEVNDNVLSVVEARKLEDIELDELSKTGTLSNIFHK